MIIIRGRESKAMMFTWYTVCFLRREGGGSKVNVNFFIRKCPSEATKMLVYRPASFERAI